MKNLIFGLVLLVLTACGQDSEPNPQVITVPSLPPAAAVQPPAEVPIPNAFIAQCNIENGVVGSGRLLVTPINQNVLVVALGSSSTQGTGASNINTTYPAVMHRLLEKNTKNVVFTVTNRGISGNSIVDMEARLDKDVISIFPQVVIVQAGANESNSGMNLDDFYATLTRVVRRLKVKSSVILMNSQTFSNEPSNYKGFISTMERVAAEQNLAIIDRYGIFSSSVNKKIITLQDILWSDNYHNNDLGYQCMGKIAAELVVSSLNK